MGFGGNGLGFGSGGGSGGGSGASAFVYGKTGFVDATNGDDSTAVWGRIDKPFQTIGNAIADSNCVSGCAIFVFAGSYTLGLNYPLPSGVSIFGPDASITTSTITISGSADNYIVFKTFTVPNDDGHGQPIGISITSSATNNVYINIETATVGTGAVLLSVNANASCYYYGKYILNNGEEIFNQGGSNLNSKLYIEIDGDIEVVGSGGVLVSYLNGLTGLLSCKFHHSYNNGSGYFISNGDDSSPVYIFGQSVSGFATAIDQSSNGASYYIFLGSLSSTTAISISTANAVYISTPNNITGTVTVGTGTLSGAINGKPIPASTTLTDAAPVTWNMQSQSTTAYLSTSNSRTLSISNFLSGMNASLVVKNNAVGAINITLPGGYLVNTGGVASAGIVTIAGATTATIYLNNIAGTFYATAYIGYT
jgi:hypothetical protein